MRRTTTRPASSRQPATTQEGECVTTPVSASRQRTGASEATYTTGSNLASPLQDTTESGTPTEEAGTQGISKDSQTADSADESLEASPGSGSDREENGDGEADISAALLSQADEPGTTGLTPNSEITEDSSATAAAEIQRAWWVRMREDLEGRDIEGTLSALAALVALMLALVSVSKTM